jgi:hypothetical protein
MWISCKLRQATRITLHILYKFLMVHIYYHSLVHPALHGTPEAGEFSRTVDTILGDKRGWRAMYGKFRRIDSREVESRRRRKGAENVFTLVLIPAKELYTLYGEFENKQLSVSDLSKMTSFFNYDRWSGRVPNKSQQPLRRYREYLVNHEVGHLLRFPHPSPDALLSLVKKRVPAPVMMQQTVGILDGMSPNTWPTEFDLELPHRKFLRPY